MIPLTETFYDFDEISHQIVGAGILPVAIDENGEACILLGKERYINHWRGSLKWSGFEGGRKMGEHITRTAAREFVEESIGVVPIANETTPTIANVEQRVKDGAYVARIVLCIMHGHETEEKRYHVTYVMQVPYDPAYNTRFAARRRAFVEVQTRTHQLARWTEQLQSYNMPLEGRLYDCVRVAAVVRVQRRDAGVVCVEFRDEDDRSHVHEFEGSVAVDLYVRWYALRKTLAADLNHLPADAFAVTCDALGLLTAVHVNEDFLEKQNIQWWSLEHLTSVLRNGGYLHSEFFRAYFLPVMQRTMSVLETAKESEEDEGLCAS